MTNKVCETTTCSMPRFEQLNQGDVFKYTSSADNNRYIKTIYAKIDGIVVNCVNLKDGQLYYTLPSTVVFPVKELTITKES